MKGFFNRKFHFHVRYDNAQVDFDYSQELTINETGRSCPAQFCPYSDINAILGCDLTSGCDCLRQKSLTGVSSCLVNEGVTLGTIASLCGPAHMCEDIALQQEIDSNSWMMFHQQAAQCSGLIESWWYEGELTSNDVCECLGPFSPDVYSGSFNNFHCYLKERGHNFLNSNKKKEKFHFEGIMQNQIESRPLGHPI